MVCEIFLLNFYRAAHSEVRQNMMFVPGSQVNRLHYFDIIVEVQYSHIMYKQKQLLVDI